MAKPESRSVGKSEAITLPPLTVVVPGDTPQDGTDNPTTRQSDKSKQRARLAAPLLLLAAVAVAAGGVLAVHEWGWWGLAAAVVAAVVLAVVAVSSWRRAARRRAASRAAGAGGAAGRTGAGTAGRRRGLLGRLAGRSGGTRQGRGGILSRLAGRPGGGGQGRRAGSGRASRSGRGGSPGRSGGRRGPLLGRGGRGPRLGRGGALLSTGSGPSLTGGSHRGKPLFGGRRGPARRTPGITRSRHSGGDMLTAPSLGIGKKLKAADAAVGTAAGRGWFATADAVTDAITTIKPDRITHHKGDTMTGIQRSRFEQITETLPQEAFTDPITDHDMGIDPMVDGMERGFENIAGYVDNVTKRMEAENYAGTEPVVLDALSAVARMVRASGAVTDEAHKILKLSPSHQDMLKRMSHANGAKSDVEAARRAGLA